VALIEKTGALDVYFEDSIQILAPEGTLEAEAISKVLAENEIEFTEIKEGSSL